MNESEFVKVYNATVALHTEGLFPSPTRVLARLGLTAAGTIDQYKPIGEPGRRVLAGPRLNGTKSLARAEALNDLGYTKNWRTGRWER